MRRKNNSPVLTGIAGADTGCGNSHLALALANTAASRLHKKTALVGMHSDAFCQMLGEGYEYREGLYHFSCLGFEVFAPADQNDLSAITDMDFDEIIVDFGHSENVSRDLAVCDRRILTGSLAPFRWRNTELFISANLNSLIGMGTLVICFGTARACRRLKKAFGMECISPPFIADPLCIPLKDANTLSALLTDKK